MSKEARDLKHKTGQKDYLSIFQPSYRDSLKNGFLISTVIVSKTKHPFLAFKFSNKLDILVHKVNLKDVKPLAKLVTFKKDTVLINGFYSGQQDGYFIDLKYSYDNDSIIEKINFTYDGKLLSKLLLADSIIKLELYSRRLRVDYEEDSDADILLVSNKRNMFQKQIPTYKYTVIFYKKGLYLYLLFIRQDNIKPDEARHLINRILGLGKE